MVEKHQLCNLQAPESDTLLSTNIGLEFSLSWEYSMSQLIHSCLCGLWVKFGGKKLCLLNSQKEASLGDWLSTK